MLRPAILYKDVIIKKFMENLYTKEYDYYVGYSCGTVLPKIEEKEGKYYWASVDESGNVIGYLQYRIDDFVDTVQDFGLFSFDAGNPILGRDLIRKLQELVSRHHRVEWCVVGDNPVKRHYDKFCKRFGGYIHHYHESTKDSDGKFVDSYCYEIVNNIEGRK